MAKSANGLDLSSSVISFSIIDLMVVTDFPESSFFIALEKKNLNAYVPLGICMNLS